MDNSIPPDSRIDPNSGLAQRRSGVDEQPALDLTSGRVTGTEIGDLLRGRGISYLSRKFILTGGCGIVTTVALFAHFITGTEYVSLTALILGMYHGANTWSQK